MRFCRLRRTALGLLLGIMLALPAAASLAAEFSAEQREAIEKIVREYLITNPDVMLEALQAAQERIKSETRAQRATALTERRRELYDDPESPVGGNPKGDVTVVEFFDYRCPYCKQVVPAIEKLLAEDKQVRFVYKEFPVLGPESVTAARAALAAREQGKYEPLHYALMGLKGQLNEAAIFNAAKAAGLDAERLKRDMADPKIEATLKANQELAQALDIRGTPAFVVGDEIVPGAVSLDALRQLVRVARSEKK
jgi:protein-disulfide isomerase